MTRQRNDSWMTAVRARAVSAGVELSEDVIRELASHLEDVYAARLAAGELDVDAREAALATLQSAVMSDLAARRRALPALQSRLVSRASAGSVLENVLLDVRYAVRMLRRSPVFATTLVAILAFSIGTIAAVVAIVDAVLLRPLPYRQPHQLVSLVRVDGNGDAGALSAADWLDYAARVSAFERLAAYANWTHNLSGDGEPLRLRSVITSGNFFEVLGRGALVGRVYTDDDDRPDAGPVVVLSEGFWARRFGRDPSAVGRTITLNGRPALVIGVMPAHFQFPARDVDLWMPIGMGPQLKSDRASEWLQAVGRLREGVPLDAAAEETRVLAAALTQAYPATNAQDGALVRPLLDTVVGDVRPALTMFAGAVFFVFVVSCLSAASLLLARASVRQDEMAVRLAVGASTSRLVRQLLVESAVLTALAASLGVALASGTLRAITLLAAGRVARLETAALNGPVIAALVVASALVVIVCGVSAMVALRRDSRAAPIRAGGRLARGEGLRPLLLTAQIALCFVLVATAVLVAGSYLRLQQVPSGLDTADVVSMRITLPRQTYPDNAAHVRFADAVQEQLSGIPGVGAAGVINDLPFAGNQMSFAVTSEAPPTDAAPRATVRLASPGYFRTLGVGLLAGRHLDDGDREGRAPVAVVNQRAAARLFDGDAVGRRIRVGETAEWRLIVGVVEDTRHAGFFELEGPVVYLPYAQKPFAFVNWIGILARTVDVDNVTPQIRRRIAAIDNTQPVYDVMRLDEYRWRAEAPFRLNSWLVGMLALLSLLLAVAGVFALTAYNAAARRQEFGIRLALGATRAAVARLIFADAARVVLPGMILGATASYYAARFVSALLFEMSSADPRVYAGVSLALGAAVFAASLPAALQTARLDPVSTMRAE